ncbi:hypothetical protein MA16_Dca025818 [Dendrobium catenatum]|uniref:Reverse transcriptase zinc-binding domain-containing protein n=1 Tax=Dendrobium catenatum TaxID=906689 RepID=A0A2I0WYS7_9ASPA|nr:hypothetical protein MA16_Dca025818 [Dendrobium catenatum]
MEWDHWCGGRSLHDIMPNYKFRNPLVKSYLKDNCWAIPPSTPYLLLNEIVGINIIEQPRVTWDGAVNPSFSTFYTSFFTHLEEVSWHKFIWHKRKSLRFSAYAWMALLGKLKTADLLLMKGINVLSDCSFCSTGSDNHSHLFFACDFSYSVIISLLPPLEVFLLRPNLLQTFEFFEDSQEFCCWEKIFCYFTICSSIYFLWRERNTRRFDNVWKSPTLLCGIIRLQAILAKVKNWKHYDDLNRRFDINR